jgi:hypothetical protein
MHKIAISVVEATYLCGDYRLVREHKGQQPTSFEYSKTELLAQI